MRGRDGGEGEGEGRVAAEGREIIDHGGLCGPACLPPATAPLRKAYPATLQHHATQRYTDSPLTFMRCHIRALVLVDRKGDHVGWFRHACHLVGLHLREERLSGWSGRY